MQNKMWIIGKGQDEMRDTLGNQLVLKVAIPELLQSYTWHNGGYYRAKMFEQIRDRIIGIGEGGCGWGYMLKRKHRVGCNTLCLFSGQSGWLRFKCI